MILIIGAILLGIALLAWLWKVPIRKMVKALKKGGSSAFEAYTLVFLLASVTVFAVYMILMVV